jgi:hypothetical protein
MATIKRCDLCAVVWDPKDHESYDGADEMSCVVSVIAPQQGSHYARPQYSETYETCQDCARVVIATLNDLAQKANPH